MQRKKTVFEVVIGHEGIRFLGGEAGQVIIGTSRNKYVLDMIVAGVIDEEVIRAWSPCFNECGSS